MMDNGRRSKKRETVDSTPADLISDLPGNIIDGIMERLPLRHAARMCVLSHKWKDIWTSTPQLMFDGDFFWGLPRLNKYLTNNFGNIVSKVLLQHDGPIHKFSLYVPSRKFSLDVTQWVSFLSRNGIRDFSLVNEFKLPLKLSSRLFSCEGLEKLNLDNCEISVPPKFRGFRKLVSLELYKVTFRECTFEDLIASCALLENVSLINWVGFEHVNVDAPNLRHLKVNGTFRSLRVKSVENLVSALITLEKLVKISHKTSLRDLTNFLANSSKIEKLSFGGYFCKVLFKQSLAPTTFEKLRSLDLLTIHLDDLDELSCAISAIQCCPNIVNLNIYVKTSKDLDEQLLEYNSDVALHRLRYAKVGMSSAFTTELKLIEFLLACSPVLEVLSLTSITRIEEFFRSRMEMVFNHFRKASQELKIIWDPCMFEDYSSSATSSSSESDSDSQSSSSSSSSSSSASSSDSDSSESID